MFSNSNANGYKYVKRAAIGTRRNGQASKSQPKHKMLLRLVFRTSVSRLYCSLTISPIIHRIS
jgi:hypothetical protein